MRIRYVQGSAAYGNGIGGCVAVKIVRQINKCLIIVVVVGETNDDDVTVALHFLNTSTPRAAFLQPCLVFIDLNSYSSHTVRLYKYVCIHIYLFKQNLCVCASVCLFFMTILQSVCVIVGFDATQQVLFTIV